jgi:hypothetical protein
VKYKSDEPCLVCQTESVDRTYHHVKTRGSGGCDSDWNKMSLCQSHHVEVHKIGLVSFSKKYSQIKSWLLRNDWEFDSNFNKWYHS